MKEKHMRRTWQMYTEYSYLWPPRPSNAIPDMMLGFYERKGFVGQIKKNGTCTVIFTNGTDVIYKTRHDDDHKMWNAPAHISDYFKSLSVDGKWCVFVAELLHNKTPLIKNVLYIFDVIVWQGRELTGTTFSERQDILMAIPQLETASDHYVVSDGVWIAKLITKFKKTWAALENPEDEGIVLKDPTIKMAGCNTQSANSKWQVKCRVKHKNYSF